MFNLADYEPVEERLERFYKDHKDGRVITELAFYDESRVLFKAFLYRNFDEEKAWATGFAEETRGKGGMVNTTSHVENCETSAIGRALANAGYAPKGKRPSKEEMTKVAETQKLDLSLRMTEKQKKLISVLLAQTNTDPVELKTALKVDSMNDLNMSQASRAIELLQTKGAVQ